MNKHLFFDVIKFREVFDFMSKEDVSLFVDKLFEKEILKKEIPTKKVKNSKHGDGELHQLCIDYHKENPSKYPPEFYTSFLEYWTAPIQKGRSKNRELWRDEKTFQIGQRLANSYKLTWNNGTSNKATNGNSSIKGYSNKPRTIFIDTSEGIDKGSNVNGIKTIRIE